MIKQSQRFYIYLAVLALWALVVPFIFKYVSERPVAAVIAGIGFILWPGLLMLNEFRVDQIKNYFFWLATGQFWLLFAWPMFLLRVLNWGTPFEQLSFLGVPGPMFHEYSTKSYTLMLILMVVQARLVRKPAQPQTP